MDGLLIWNDLTTPQVERERLVFHLFLHKRICSAHDHGPYTLATSFIAPTRSESTYPDVIG